MEKPKEIIKKSRSVGFSSVGFLGKETRNSKILGDFVNFCIENPELRFWQALRTWAEIGYLMADDIDTFFWEGKNE